MIKKILIVLGIISPSFVSSHEGNPVRKLLLAIFLMGFSTARASTILNVPFNGNANDSGPNTWNFTNIGSVPFILANVTGGFPSTGMAGQFGNTKYFTNPSLWGYLTSTAGVVQLDFDVYIMDITSIPVIIGETSSTSQLAYYSPDNKWRWISNGATDEGIHVAKQNQWQHVEMVCGTTTKILIVDGIQEINTGGNGKFAGTAMLFGTGAVASNWWTGYVSNLVVVNAALTPTNTPTQVVPPVISISGTPVVTPAYTWEAGQMGEPSVVKNGSKLFLYFTGSSVSPAIGLLTASASVYPGPGAWADGLVTGNPVIGDGYGNTSHSVARANVVWNATESKWFAYGFDTTTNNIQLFKSSDGYAFTPVSWTCAAYTETSGATSLQNNKETFDSGTGNWYMSVNWQAVSGLFYTALYVSTDNGNVYHIITSPQPYMAPATNAALTGFVNFNSVGSILQGYLMTTTSTAQAAPEQIYFASGQGAMNISVYKTPVIPLQPGAAGEGDVYDYYQNGQLDLFYGQSLTVDSNEKIYLGQGPTPTFTISPTYTWTPTATPTVTPSNTQTWTPTASPSATPTASPTISPTFTASQTFTSSPTATPIPTATPCSHAPCGNWWDMFSRRRRRASLPGPVRPYAFCWDPTLDLF
jgi:hypothetical protein